MNPPPDRIETLKDILWYLYHYSFAIPVIHDGEYIMLRDATPEVWATNVAHWLENNQLPARVISEPEAKALIRRIEHEGGQTSNLEVTRDDGGGCCGGSCHGGGTG